jgi:hypothetical protein
MVLAMICITAMVPATLMLPPMAQAIRKVAKLPVNLQVSALIMLRPWLSFNYSNTISDLHVTFTGHIPFLYAVFHGGFTAHGHSYLKVFHQMFHTVFKHPPH